MRRRIALAETSSADAFFVAITPRYRCPCARMRAQSNDFVTTLGKETHPRRATGQPPSPSPEICQFGNARLAELA